MEKKRKSIEMCFDQLFVIIQTNDNTLCYYVESNETNRRLIITCIFLLFIFSTILLKIDPLMWSIYIDALIRCYNARTMNENIFKSIDHIEY